MGLSGTTHTAKELGNHLEEQLGEKQHASLGSLVPPYGDINDTGSLCLQCLKGLALCSVVPVTHMIIFQAFKLGQQALFVQRAPLGGYSKKSRLNGDVWLGDSFAGFQPEEISVFRPGLENYKLPNIWAGSTYPGIISYVLITLLMVALAIRELNRCREGLNQDVHLLDIRKATSLCSESSHRSFH